MNRFPWFFGLLLVFFSSQHAAGQPDSAAKSGVSASIFQALRVGQKVSLKQSFGFWEVSVLNNGEIGLNTILEITPTHLLLDDPVQVTKFWIPTSSVSRVTVMKIPGTGTQPIKQ